jgi:DNA-directed RNA polymerase subunit M/transcription elongation factor TFIIS
MLNVRIKIRNVDLEEPEECVTCPEAFNATYEVTVFFLNKRGQNVVKTEFNLCEKCYNNFRKKVFY